MATARVTLGALLDTVGTAASTVNDTLNGISSTVGMFNQYVDKAAKTQRMRYAADELTMLDRILEEKAQEQAAVDIQIDEFKGRSEKHNSYYERAYAKYEAILKPNKGLKIAAE